MKTFIKLFAIIHILIFFGCVNESKEGIKELLISDNVIEDAFSSIISTYEVIGLDDQVDAYFDSPLRMILTDSLMIFAVPRPTPRILLFDNEGKYIRSIGKKGRGPGEINSIDDITFNEKDKTISVFQRNKALILDLNGNLVEEILLDFNTVKVLNVGSGYLVEKRIATGDSLTDYQIRYVDKNFKTIDKSMPLKEVKLIGTVMEGQTNRANINQSYSYFFPITGDTIFHLIGKSFRPVYKLTYDKEVFTQILLKEASQLTGEYLMEFANQDLYRRLHYYEIGNLRLLHFSNNKKSLCYVYDEHLDTDKLLEDSYPLNGVHDNSGIILTKSLSLEKIIDKNIDPERNKCSNPDVLKSLIGRSGDDFVVIIKIKFKD